jgi:hypothetical protein
MCPCPSWIRQRSLCNYATLAVVFGYFYLLLAGKYMPTIGAALKLRLKIFHIFGEKISTDINDDSAFLVAQLTEVSAKERGDLQVIHNVVCSVHCALLAAIIQHDIEDTVDIVSVNNILEAKLNTVTVNNILPFEYKL